MLDTWHEKLKRENEERVQNGLPKQLPKKPYHVELVGPAPRGFQRMDRHLPVNWAAQTEFERLFMNYFNREDVDMRTPGHWTRVTYLTWVDSTHPKFDPTRNQCYMVFAVHDENVAMTLRMLS